MVGTYIQTPLPLRKRRSLCNIKNRDSLCFAYSVLASMYPANINKTRPSHYKPFIKKLNLDGLVFPLPIDSIPVFETKNSEFLILIF